LIQVLPTTLHRRAQEKRQQELDHIRQQVENGTLVIRKMTPRSNGRIRRVKGGTPGESIVHSATVLAARLP
jgi:hypothetical protein